MSYTIKVAELEVDTDRGVIWVHGPKGDTKLRICRFKGFIPPKESLEEYGQMIDITARERVKNEDHDN
jgi:hypothetical protein